MTGMTQTSHANTTSGVTFYRVLIIKYDLFIYGQILAVVSSLNKIFPPEIIFNILFVMQDR